MHNTKLPLLVFLLLPLTASAHVGLLEPAPRYGTHELKPGPCGRAGGQRSANVATYDAGATITVRFDEYVDHPSHYRIAFDPDGDDDFADPVCLSNCDVRDATVPTFADDTTGTVLLDRITDTPEREQTVTIRLPDVTCNNCTLQLIQVMYDKRPYTIGGDDNYYQCADLVLRRAATDAGTGDAGQSDAGQVDAGQVDAGQVDAGQVDSSAPEVDGSAGATASADGCQCGAVGTSSVEGWLLLAFVVTRRRSKHRQRELRNGHGSC